MLSILLSVSPIAIIILILIIIFSMANTKTTPKDVFLHLFNIVTFYLTVIGFITLYINYIEALFPDPLNYYYNNIASGVRWASSVLFVAVPSYILTAWLLNKDILANIEKRDLSLRKWLTYLTLFVSALTIIIDLMVFVYNFLEGELTVRFFLKVLVVLVVAGGVFGYYMWDLKRKDLKTQVNKILAMVLSIIVLGSIIAGFFIVGSPGQQRDRRMDEERIMDLQNIQGEISNYWSRKEVVPASLADLEDSISGFKVPADPETKQPYKYKVTGDLAFELCATFGSSNLDEEERIMQETYYAYDKYNQNWTHYKGEVCFARIIDPELYKDLINLDTKIYVSSGKSMGKVSDFLETEDIYSKYEFDTDEDESSVMDAVRRRIAGVV